MRIREGLGAILVLIGLLAYDPARPENTSGETISARYWPIAVLKHGEFRLNYALKELSGVAYSGILMPDGDLLPRVDLGIAAFSFPIYTLADWLGLGGNDWDATRINRVARWNGLALTLISLLLLYALGCRFATPVVSFVSTGVFALGTYSWSVGPQGLSPQTATVVNWLIAMHILWKVTQTKAGLRVSGYALALGLLTGLAWATEPRGAVLLVPALVSLIGRRSLRPYFGGISLSVGTTLLLNHHFFRGNWLGWRSLVETPSGVSGDVFSALLGLLLSPNRGALVFFPLLLLTPWLWRRYMPPLQVRKALRDLLAFRIPAAAGLRVHGITPAFSRALAAGAVTYLLLIARRPDWHANWSYGPRYLYEIQPLVWPAITVGFSRLGQDWAAFRQARRKPTVPRWAQILLVAGSLLGIGVHALGHLNYDLYVWNFGHGEIRNEDAWDTQDAMIPAVWEAGSNRDRRTDALTRLKDYGY